MSRTTVELVRGILPDNELTDTIIETYIKAAVSFMTGTVEGKGLKECTLEEIERWLTAHFISVTRERIAKKEGAGGAFIEYAGDFGAGLNATSYGQMAVLLDTTGTLTALGKSPAMIYGIPEY